MVSEVGSVDVSPVGAATPLVCLFVLFFFFLMLGSSPIVVKVAEAAQRPTAASVFVVMATVVFSGILQ